VKAEADLHVVVAMHWKGRGWPTYFNPNPVHPPRGARHWIFMHSNASIQDRVSQYFLPPATSPNKQIYRHPNATARKNKVVPIPQTRPRTERTSTRVTKSRNIAKAPHEARNQNGLLLLLRVRPGLAWREGSRVWDPIEVARFFFGWYRLMRSAMNYSGAAL
jgi:hypothetical protein